MAKRILIIFLVFSFVFSNLYHVIGGSLLVKAEGENPILIEGKSKLVIPNEKNISGNITLPNEIDVNGNKINITWESSNPNVISDKETGESGEIPAGVVKRQSTDQNVKLTAIFEFNGEVSEKVFDTVVKEAIKLEDFKGYIYTYFRANLYGDGESQQIHLASSKDGLFWDDMNNNEPILESTLGTKGLRDSYVVRSPEGDKFYLIATDLDANAGDWAQYANNGSKSIMVWESDDLINWSDQRMIEIAPGDAGNAWAPETIYDPTTGEYVVYWASNVDGHNIYYAKTRDFWTFTKPEIYVPKTETNTFIDTSMIEHNGSYYRFTKNEQDISVFLEKSDSVLGDFELVKNKVGDQGGVEGPGIFKMNGIEKWILLLDGYAGSNSGAGFFPLIAESTEDLDKGNFRRLENTEFRMPTGAKHGSILPVTQKEYDAVMEKWGKDLVKPVAPDTGEKIIPDLKYTFDEDLQGATVKNTGASSVQNNGKLHNGASYKEDAEKGKVLYLGGGNAGTDSQYLEFPQGYFDGKDNVSIFMDIKSEMDNQFFFTFGVGQNEQKYLFLRTRSNEIYSTLTVKSWSKEQKVIEQLSSPIKNTWTNIGIVLERNVDGNHSTMKLYKDGVLVGEETQLVANLSTMGADLKAYLGKAFYNDPYFKGAFDNVRVYNRALTDEQVNHVVNQDPEEPGEEDDETPPEGQFTINNGAEFTNKSTANLSLEAKDDLSGVHQVRYSTVANEWSEWEEYKSSKELKLPAGDGEKTVLVEFKDHAGNISESYQQKITLDTTAPVIEFTGYQETYSVDSFIKITCSISDKLSGIATKECENVEGPAYEFELGINKIKATATDKAGNTAKAEIEFTVTVDFDSLGRLTEAFVTKEGVAESLAKKLQSAKESAAKGNNQAMNGQLNAYENQLKAQSGKSISEENTKILINLLKELK